ncbi:MAG TPA: hypothetical protein VHC22_34465 [Pirellulales bacterium]|nr:hypothetical protein [Pirellulales bacterium]
MRPANLISAAAALLSLGIVPWTVGLADEPAISYIFPAGGQRGTHVEFRVGGLYLHEGADFEMLGPGVVPVARIAPTNTVWFEGPLLPLAASQQKEDYPKDYAGHVDIAVDASLGVRAWRVATSQGATPSMKFVVGELPEMIEEEIDGAPVPVAVSLPVTINGRIFPREDVDDWTFTAKQGETIRAEVMSARLGLPLEARLVLYNAAGRPLAEDVGSLEGDPCLHAVIPADGNYRLRIHDVNFGGLQHYVYRLTLTSGPFVERVFPLGGRRGSTVQLEVVGQALPAAPVEMAIPTDAEEWHVARLPLVGGLSNPIGLETDDLPESLEVEPNGATREATTVSPPAMCNGRIAAAGDRDVWAFQARRGEAFDLTVSAARLGSPLAAILVVEGADGKELARGEESPASRSDVRVRFTAPEDGCYFVCLTDRFASRGGPAFAYRLRIAPPGEGDFRLTLSSDAVTLYRGGQAKVRVTAERTGNFGGAIDLAVEGLPVGVTTQSVQIAANQSQVEIPFAGGSKIGATRLTVRGLATIGDRQVAHVATLPTRVGEAPVDSVLLAVSMPTPFEVQGQYDLAFAPRGTTLKRHYSLRRFTYDGPLTVRLADRQARHLQGVTGPLVTVPAGASECDYPVFLPPWMELGRTSRSVVMAVGVVVDSDGSQHTVSFTSQNQNEQIVALVGPGEMSVQASRTSLACLPNTQAELRVRIARGVAQRQPAKLELVLPPHVRGISAEPVIVPGDGDEGVLKICCGPEFGPLNMPAKIRAIIERDDRPVVAETALDLVSGAVTP